MKTYAIVAILLAAIAIPTMSTLAFAKDTCGEDVKEINIKIVNPKAGAGSTIGPINICPNVDLKPLSDRVDSLAANATADRADVSQVKTDVAGAVDTANKASQAVGGIQNNITSMQGEVAVVNSRITDVENTLTGVNSSINGINARIDGVDKRIDNLTGIQACVVYANGTSAGTCTPGPIVIPPNNTGGGNGTGTNGTIPGPVVINETGNGTVVTGNTTDVENGTVIQALAGLAHLMGLN